MLGIDEAGRGSVLGPLVVGGFLIEGNRLEQLVSLGVRDSKLLPRERREQIYAKLPTLGRCASIALEPPEIDRWVERGRLNQLEALAFAKLIRRLKPTEVFLDACDPVEHRFALRVKSLARSECSVIARHHADRDFPVVSAASIVAKVRRDRSIDRLQNRLGTTIGSGYPADDLTVKYARSALDQGLGKSPWIRQSWATTRRLKAERAARTLDQFLR